MPRDLLWSPFRHRWRLTTAIRRRLIPAAAALPNGEQLTVTASADKGVQHIRGFGFIGLPASGAHHPPRHLAMVKAAFDREHRTR